MMAAQTQQPNEEHDRLTRKVGHKAQRKLVARRRGPPRVLSGLGLFGIVGWSVAAPTLVGVALGYWLDLRWPGQVSWTVALLFAGVALGCANAWYWVKRESGKEQE